MRHGGSAADNRRIAVRGDPDYGRRLHAYVEEQQRQNKRNRYRRDSEPHHSVRIGAQCAVVLEVFRITGLLGQCAGLFWFHGLELLSFLLA